jgi:hypothetical protein
MMATPSSTPETEQSQSAWAEPVTALSVDEAPEGAMNLNVDGRQLASPLQGFGQMWQKTFRVRLVGVDLSPEAALKVWQNNFPSFQPPQNRFYPTMSGIKPGEVILINAKVPPLPGLPSMLPVSTGVMVLYADDEMFTVMCPEGHPLSGWNNFRVFEDDEGMLVAEVQEQSRASDPMYEFFFRVLGSSSQQDDIWVHVLTQLAAHLGVKNEEVGVTRTLIDPRVQWSAAKNIWKNAGIRTIVYLVGTPFRWAKSTLGRSDNHAPR